MTTTTKIEPMTALPVDSRGRVRTPPEHRNKMMDLFEQSGLTGAAFAQLHGIRYTTFSHWRRVRRREREESNEEQSLTFREVDIHPSTSRSGDGLLLELPQGVRVRLESPHQIPLVAALTHQLRISESC
jgi:transposase-like protein